MAITVYTYNDKVLKNIATNKWLKKPEGPNYNPYNLPAKTFRVKLGSSWSGDPSITVTQVEGDIYDITFPSDSTINSFSKSAVTGLLGANCTGLTAVPNALTSLTGTVGNLYLPDTTSLYNFFAGSSITSIGDIYAPNVTNTSGMCSDNSQLTSIASIYAPNVTNASNMFKGCGHMLVIPNLIISSLTNVDSMFKECFLIGTGVLEMYNSLNALGNQITSHTQTFYGCGVNAPGGMDVYNQIPSDWK